MYYAKIRVHYLKTVNIKRGDKEMEIAQIEAKLRNEIGKGASNRARREGFIPAELYGKEKDNISVMVSENEMEKLINRFGENALIKVFIDNDGKKENYTVLLKEIQRHPVRGTLSHIDFHQVSMTDKINTIVPVVLVGDSPGVSEGGILQQLVRELDIRCLPTDIPGSIELDISNLNIGDSLSVSDVNISEEIEIVTDENTVIASVVAPQVVEETEAAEEAEATEEATEAE